MAGPSGKVLSGDTNFMVTGFACEKILDSHLAAE